MSKVPKSIGQRGGGNRNMRYRNPETPREADDAHSLCDIVQKSLPKWVGQESSLDADEEAVYLNYYGHRWRIIVEIVEEEEEH